MSKQGYESILPRLEKLAPGDDVGSLLIKEARLFAVTEVFRKTTHIVIPGWIGGLSGAREGLPFDGYSGLGKAFAKSGSSIRGRHVFGYMWGGMNLAPQFQVITEATVIEKTEFDGLTGEQVIAMRAGRFPGESGWRYYRDLRVVEAGLLPFPGAPVEWRVVEREDGDPVAALYTESAFRETEEKLRALPAGTDLWRMLLELHAFFISSDYGLSYAIGAKGFFGDETRSIDTEDAIYGLRPFGYVEAGRRVIKLIAVFKNDRLERVVSHTGLADWSGYVER